MARRTDETDRELLERTHRLAEENYRMLRALRREAWFGFFVKIVIWAAILGVPVYLYFTVLEPIFGDVKETYQGVQESTRQVQELGSQAEQFEIPENLKSVLQSIGIQVE